MSTRPGRTHTCPWWLTPWFDNSLRRWFQDPTRTLQPVVWPGARVLDLGCGMGYLAVPAARLVGPGGTVHAVDLQQKSLDALARRAHRAGVAERIQIHCQDVIDLELPEPVDAAYAMWMLHEVADLHRFAGRLVWLLPTAAPLLVVEPRIHVSARRFDHILDTLRSEGFSRPRRVDVGLSRAAILAAP